METAALAEVVGRTRGDTGAAAGMTLEISLGQIARHMKWQRERILKANSYVHDIPIPAVQFPLNAGATTLPPNTSLLGPEDGQVWDVRRVTVQGLSSTQTVDLFMELNSPNAGNPQNYVFTFSAKGTTPGPTWTPSGGLIVHSPGQLILVGSGLTVPPVLSGMVIQVADPYLADYLI
jgi:hypothetical protein